MIKVSLFPKRIVKKLSLLLACIIILGSILNTNILKASAHETCIFTKNEHCYNSFSGTNHPYPQKIYLDDYGNVVDIVYGTCHTVVYQYHIYWRCSCGSTEYQHRQEVHHMNCGTSTEVVYTERVRIN